MKKLFGSFVLIIILVSCGTSKTSWLGFNIDNSAIGEADQLLLLYPDIDNNTFKIHWFIYQKADEMSMFVMMSFEDTVSYTSETNLPATLTFNQVKLNSGKSMNFPIDQDPNFKYKTQGQVLWLHGKKAEFLREYTTEEVENLKQEYKNWDGFKVSLYD